MNDLGKTVTIKLKPYLQEFYQCSQFGGVNTSRKSYLGSVLFPFITRMPKHYVPTLSKDEDSLEVQLLYINGKEGVNIRGNVYIPENYFKQIQRILERHFIDMFYTYVDDKVRYRVEVKGMFRSIFVNDVIFQFCTDFEMNYSTRFEMLKKRYYRERRKRTGDELNTGSQKRKKVLHNIPTGELLLF